MCVAGGGVRVCSVRAGVNDIGVCAYRQMCGSGVSVKFSEEKD